MVEALFGSSSNTAADPTKLIANIALEYCLSSGTARGIVMSGLGIFLVAQRTCSSG